MVITLGEVDIQQDEIVYSSDTMKLKINNNEFERGELILTKSVLAWKKNGTNNGFTIPWNKIVVQAISPEHQRSIYVMLDCEFPAGETNRSGEEEAANGNGNHQEEAEAENEEDDNEDFIECDEDQPEITEFWFSPENSEDIDNIYYHLGKLGNEEMEEEDDEDEFLDGEDMEQMNINDDNDMERFADA